MSNRDVSGAPRCGASSRHPAGKRHSSRAIRRAAAGVLEQPEFFVFDDVTNGIPLLRCRHAFLQAAAHGTVITDTRGEKSHQIEEITIGGQAWFGHGHVRVVAKPDQLPVDLANLLLLPIR